MQCFRVKAFNTQRQNLIHLSLASGNEDKPVCMRIQPEHGLLFSCRSTLQFARHHVELMAEWGGVYSCYVFVELDFAQGYSNSRYVHSK